MIGLVLPCLATAQRGTAGAGRPAGVHPGIGVGRGQFFPFGFGGNRGFGRNTPAVWGAPFGWGLSDNFSDNGACSVEAPSVPREFALPVEPPLPPPPPQPPVHSVIREYSWPNTNGNSTARFAIVSKDGQVRFAAAVWFQNGTINFTDVNGNAIHADVNTVDMESTRKLNAQAGLRWPLDMR
jgi:hypothetical protein